MTEAKQYEEVGLDGEYEPPVWSCPVCGNCQFAGAPPPDCKFCGTPGAEQTLVVPASEARE